MNDQTTHFRQLLTLAALSGLCVLCLHPSSANGQPIYEIVDLGALNYSAGYGINEKGQVSGRDWDDMRSEAVFWDDGIQIMLGRLPRHEASACWYTAMNVNESSTVLIIVDDESVFESVLWSEDTGLIDPEIEFSEIPGALDDAGRFCLTEFGQNVYQTHAYLWLDGELTQLPHGSYYEVGSASLNNAGQVVGSGNDIFSDYEAVLWPNVDEIINIHPSFAQASRAVDINDAGQIVGYFQLPGPDERLHVFLYENGEHEDLTYLEDNQLSSLIDALAINNVGEIVGTDWVGQTAFLIRDGVRYDLFDIIDDPNEEWYKITRAFDINDAGWIVGKGGLEGVGSRAFLMIPQNEFRTTGLSPGLAGEVNTIRAYDATPNGRVVITYGFGRGEFTIPYICPGVTLDIHHPQFGALARADGEGNVTFERPVTPMAEDVTVYFQAIDVISCKTSPVVVHHFPVL